MLERLLSDVSPEVARVLDAALRGRELGVEDALLLMRTQGADFQALTRAADVARAEDVGEDVSFVINRNINFTNVCYVGCSFCGFARHKDEDDAYDHPMTVMIDKARDAISRGATEVCIQGGIHVHVHLLHGTQDRHFGHFYTQLVQHLHRIVQNPDLFAEVGSNVHGHIGHCNKLMVGLHFKIGKMGEQLTGAPSTPR